MLTRAEKEAIIGQIKDNISKSQAVFLTNLIGIPSNDAVKVRKGVRDASGGLVITRNTLLQKAAEGTMCEEIVKDLQGPHALAFAYEDSAAIAKVLHEAGKEFDPVELKAGVLDGKILTNAELEQLANLPSKDQMLATLLATFNAPISAFARVMHAIKESKEENVAE